LGTYQQEIGTGKRNNKKSSRVGGFFISGRKVQTDPSDGILLEIIIHQDRSKISTSSEDQEGK
jgi:hypothetical protein